MFDCENASPDVETCPTELTIIASDLKTVPKNLFANYFTRLNFLNLSNCGIEEISKDSFIHAGNLIKLDLSRNKITKLLESTFVFAPKIEIIDLSHNQISHSVDKLTFDNCTSLRELDLSYNNMITNDWVAPLANLEVLHLLEFNRVNFNIEEYYNNTNLVTLYATNFRSSHSQTSFGDSNISIHLPKLKHLILSDFHFDTGFQTNIEKYYQKTLDKDLSILNVEGRGLNSLTIPGNFKIIIANVNEIESVLCPEVNHVVTELYLSRNRLLYIDSIVEKLPNLEIADFSSNHIGLVRETHFSKLTHLVELNLANSLLIDINIGILEQLPSLKVLDISNNYIKGHLKLSSNATIESVNITGNSYTSIHVGTKAITFWKKESNY